MKLGNCIVIGLSFGLVGSLSAQIISLDVYHERQLAGGVAMEAHYDLGAGWDSVHCDPANIRWIQMITLIDDHGAPKTDVPGYPHSTFIDPEPGGSREGRSTPCRGTSSPTRKPPTQRS